MAENLSLDQLMANAKGESVEIPEEILNGVAGGMTQTQWQNLPADIQVNALAISDAYRAGGLTCDYDAIVEMLMNK